MDDVFEQLSPRQQMRAKVVKILGDYYHDQISIGAVEAILNATELKDVVEIIESAAEPNDDVKFERTHFRGGYLCRNCGVQSNYHGAHGECLRPDQYNHSMEENPPLEAVPVSQPSAEDVDQTIAERDREWCIALSEVDVAALANSVRHGKINVEYEPSQTFAGTVGKGNAPQDAREWAGILTRSNPLYCIHKYSGPIQDDLFNFADQFADDQCYKARRTVEYWKAEHNAANAALTAAQARSETATGGAGEDRPNLHR